VQFEKFTGFAFVLVGSKAKKIGSSGFRVGRKFGV
jgi:hypothetical protein